MVGARTPRRGSRREDSSRKKDEPGDAGEGCGAEETERDETRTKHGGRWGGEGNREEEKRRLARRGALQGSFRNARREQNCRERERERERERGYDKTGSLSFPLDYFSFFFFFFFFSPSFALLPLSISSFLLFPLSRCFYFYTRGYYPWRKVSWKRKGKREREKERKKKEESRGSRVVCPRYRRARLKGTHGRMVHMDLEMFAGRAVQILIKRNIFRMRAPTGTGETKRRVPFLILSRHAWKNASPFLPFPSYAIRLDDFRFCFIPFPVSFASLRPVDNNLFC